MRIVALTDNAMLYKDITQWLRDKRFHLLFLGLLSIAEAVCAIGSAVPTDPGRAGPIIFSFLAFLLGMYALAIAAMGHTLTVREFADQTFDLYEIAGMSLERMVWGKLLSLLSQFLFGFFCIVPFLFFAFLLGGLDFYTVFVAIIVALVFSPLLYLMSLGTSLIAKKKKSLSRGQSLGAVASVFAVFLGFSMLRGMRGLWGFSLDGLVKEILSLKTEVLIGAGIFLGFYIQIVLSLFYLCCNAISPASDSRETATKLLVFTLSASWMALFAGTMAHDGDFRSQLSHVACIPIMIVMCLSGVQWLYGRFDAPVMVRIRHENAHGSWTRLAYFLFQPGSVSGFRTLLMLWLVAVAYALFVYSFVGPGGHFDTVNLPALLSSVSLPLAVPFFIAFPFGFFLRFEKLRSKPAPLRVLALCWWAVVGGVFLALAMIAQNQDTFFAATINTVIVYVAAGISPLSSGFIISSAYLNTVPFIRIGLGICGILLLAFALRKPHGKEQAS